MEGKYKIQSFEGDIPMSLESVCINDEEEDISDTEYESNSDICFGSDEE